MSKEKTPEEQCRLFGGRRYHKSRFDLQTAYQQRFDSFLSEDVDPTVGRFRNLVQTAIVGGGKRKAGQDSKESKKRARILMSGREDISAKPYSSVLGSSSISAAPSLDLYSNISPTVEPFPGSTASIVTEDDSSKKKKYAKEAWPGRKPVHSVI